MIISREGIYNYSDHPTPAELQSLGAVPPGIFNQVKVIWTGEKRPPRKGEWFLSGAIIEGYKALHDLCTPYHIGCLVRVENRLQVVKTL